jgi:hypothetical protein
MRGCIQIGAAKGRDAGAHRSGQIARGRSVTHRLSQDGTGFCFHRRAYSAAVMRERCFMSSSRLRIARLEL